MEVMQIIFQMENPNIYFKISSRGSEGYEIQKLIGNWWIDAGCVHWSLYLIAYICIDSQERL